ncbi:S8 family serine peptidase [Neobacillus sp. NPDC097160]|uniref:S8 family serine peptidase n=1 Tax=Neobacillus sp. NPDC097160 TaxID=3364298 RepID=UPI0037F69786
MSKKNQNKKIATYALASALVLSNLGFVSTASAETYKPGDLESKLKQVRDFQAVQKQSLKALDAKSVNAKANLKATDKVRVIVEVEGQTPVEYATKQGKLYKELSEDKKSSLTSKLQGQQKSVKDKISSKGINVKYKQTFSTAFNGFSGEVAFGDISKIEGIAGVKNVFIANEYNRPVIEPNMKTSHQFIQSRDTWSDSGYKGEGMVVAVIDTGVDPSHRDFKLTDNSSEELSKDGVGKIVSDSGLKGKFYTDKVPYGYNYYDQNNTILDLGPGASMHGMHVAGTVAANGDEANGGIKGVAPEAQVLAMKVFSNDPLFPSTTSDVYLAAIDDSIKLGADVLNMSLGSTASFYDENSAEDLAIQRATANGIVCAVSAGNSQTLGYGWDNPFAKNPDIGVVGAPGLNPDTISVAASGNEAFLYQHAITVEGNTTFTAVGKGIDDWTKLAAGKLDLVSLGNKLGAPEDYKGLDVKGKIVVVPRGSLTFVDKTKNAAAAGAAGIIVWNATNGAPYDNQGGWDAPFMFITKAEGEALNAAILAGQTSLHVDQIQKNESPEMGRMTDFSSWGTTPSLEMKPEITAPGGNIYSTVNNDKYELMSGTSMASPHVAGGSALVQEYLQSDKGKKFGALSVGERTHLAKVLLMNTAKVIKDLDGNPFSPRREGAGMMQLHSAVSTPVYFVNKSTGEAKVELKDFQSKQISMTFTAKNVSDKDVMYKVDTSVLTDIVQNYQGTEYNALAAAAMEGAKVSAPETVMVQAGKSVDFTVKVDLTDAKIPYIDKDNKQGVTDLKEDIFVEGSVNLVSFDEKTAPSLTVPYVGFYGKWDNPSILDGFKNLGEDKFFDLDGSYAKANFGVDKVSDMLIDDWFQAPVPEKNVWTISPNGDGYNDTVNAFPAFLRNASEVQFNILDKDEKLLRRVKTETSVRKNFYNAGKGSVYNYENDREWNGSISGKTVKDGLYYYEIKSVVDYAGAKWQSKKVPVLVDTTAPKVEATYDPAKSTVSWTTTEEGSGVEIYGVFVNGKLQNVLDGKTNSYEIQNAPAKAIVEVLAIDYAQNAASDTAAIGDVDLPLIFITDGTKNAAGAYVSNSPYAYGAYNTRTVPVKGIVTDDIGLKYVKVAGKEVPIVKDAKGNLTFSTEVTFEKDGLQPIQIEAVDHSNKSFSISRYVYIDTTPAEINVDAPERVDKNVDEVTLNVELKDNLGYLDFFVGDNNVYKKSFDSEVDSQKPLSAKVKVKVPLELGNNTVTMKLYDIAGNVTVKELVINRGDQTGWVENNGAWYFYDEDGSMHTGWLEETYGDDEWGENWTVKYYFDKDGKMHTGWLDLNGKRYYFDQGGEMATDVTFVAESKTYYYFDENGAVQSGVYDVLGDSTSFLAYFDAKTGMLRNGWKLDAGSWYFADRDGRLQSGWLYQANKWYYFNNDGKMKTGWLNDGKSTYYLTDSGAMATGWTKADGKWYYFNKSGTKQTGWLKDGQKWYYLDQSGVMKTGWVQVGGKWYFLNNNGDMATGWKQVDGKWYYLNNNGDMATGWKLIDGKWYYLNASGVMAANTTIEGYKLGADGAWTK